MTNKQNSLNVLVEDNDRRRLMNLLGEVPKILAPLPKKPFFRVVSPNLHWIVRVNTSTLY